MKICCCCKIEQSLDNYHKLSKSNDGKQSKCKTCCKKFNKDNKNWRKEYNKNWLSNNNTYHIKYQKEYFQNNKEYILNRRVNYLNNNPLARLVHRLRVRTSIAIKSGGWKKKSKTYKLLGASYEEVFNYIESLFVDGMNWNRLGEIHIDHKIPLASAKTEEELLKLCHYTNLQPLWAEDNLKKSNKILE